MWLWLRWALLLLLLLLLLLREKGKDFVGGVLDLAVLINHIPEVVEERWFVAVVLIEHPTDAPENSKRWLDPAPWKGGRQRRAAVWELKEPFFGVLRLVLLTVTHVSVDQLNKPRHEQAEEFSLKPEKKMLKICGVGLVGAAVNEFASFEDASSAVETLQRLQKIFDSDEKLTQLFHAETVNGQVALTLEEEMVTLRDGVG